MLSAPTLQLVRFVLSLSVSSESFGICCSFVSLGGSVFTFHHSWDHTHTYIHIRHHFLNLKKRFVIGSTVVAVMWYRTCLISCSPLAKWLVFCIYAQSRLRVLLAKGQCFVFFFLNNVFCWKENSKNHRIMWPVWVLAGSPSDPVHQELSR